MTPQFLILGAQKCGTSWLHKQLREHPEVRIPADKDTLIFSFGRRPSAAALDQWSSRFRGGQPRQVVGDASAALFWTDTGHEYDRKPPNFNSDLVEAVRETVGSSVRLIVLLRDPVERAISAYFHHLGMGTLTWDRPLLDQSNDLGLIGIGFYAAHLHNWWQEFRPDDTLVVTESLDSRANRIRREVALFLNIRDELFPLAANDRVFEGLPRTEREDGVWMPIDIDRQPMPPPDHKPTATINGMAHVRVIQREELEALVEIYRDDLHDLADLVGEEALQHWPTWQRVRCQRTGASR